MTCSRCKEDGACAQLSNIYPKVFSPGSLVCGPCADWLYEKTGFVQDDACDGRANRLAIGRGERRKAEAEERLGAFRSLTP